MPNHHEDERSPLLPNENRPDEENIDQREVRARYPSRDGCTD